MSSSDEMMLDGRPLSSFKVAELKEELENRQLSTKGVKAVLLDRLKEALSAQDADPVVDEQNPIVAGYLARQSAALAEARKRTESETSGNATPQSDLSPTKKPAASPTKKQTPKRGRKSRGSVSDVVPDEVESEKPEKEAEPEPEAAPEPSGSSDDVQTENPDKPEESPEKEAEKVPENAEDVEDVPEDTPEEPEKVEIEEKQEPPVKLEKEDIVEKKEKAVEENQPKMEQDDGDELDYGDDEEKTDQKEEEEEDVVEEEKDPKKKKEEVVEDKKPEVGGVKKEEKVRTAEVSHHRRASSPSSRHPVSNIIHIRGLVRPFTESQLRAEIEKNGDKIVDFWIDKVKSHCFVKFATDSEAGNVLAAMNNTVWPDINPKTLAIVYETEEKMEGYKEGRETKVPEVGGVRSRTDRLSTTSQTSVLGGKTGLQITLQNMVRDNDKLETERKEKRTSLAGRLTRIGDTKEKEKVPEERKRERSATPPFSRGAGFMDMEKKARYDDGDKSSSRREESRRDDRRVVVDDEPPKKSLDQLFMKTSTLPTIYYLPLTDEQIAAKARRKSEGASGSGGRRSDRPERSDRPSGRDRSRGDRGDRPKRRD